MSQAKPPHPSDQQDLEISEAQDEALSRAGAARRRFLIESGLLTGGMVAGALANAVYHATGKRVRELPITLDKLL